MELVVFGPPFRFEEALQFAFEVAAEGSPIAGARLEIEEASGRTLELAVLEVVDDAEDR